MGETNSESNSPEREPQYNRVLTSPELIAQIAEIDRDDLDQWMILLAAAKVRLHEAEVGREGNPPDPDEITRRAADINFLKDRIDPETQHRAMEYADAEILGLEDPEAQTSLTKAREDFLDSVLPKLLEAQGIEGAPREVQSSFLQAYELHLLLSGHVIIKAMGENND